MNEPIWYIYSQGQQTGPFTAEVVLHMAHNNILAQDAYLFKVGWTDWLPFADASHELQASLAAEVQYAPTAEAQYEAYHGEVQHQQPHALSKTQPVETQAPLRRIGAPRAGIRGRVIVHNNGQLVIGSGVNISRSGIFVESKEEIFTVGETLKLTVKCEGIGRPFNVTALVVRYNSDPKYPVGYGLRFEDLDARVLREIDELVRKQNIADDRTRAAQ